MRGSNNPRSDLIIACSSAGEPPIGSEATVAMNMFLTVTGHGAAYAGPGTKR